MSRVNITLDDSTARLLERVDNRSGYIQRAVQERWREWQAAHMYATAHGWTGAELLAACAALNGHLVAPFGGGAEDIALALSAARVYEEAATDISPDRWAQLVAGVRADADLWRALWVISREWWADNAHLRSLLERD